MASRFGFSVLGFWCSGFWFSLLLFRGLVLGFRFVVFAFVGVGGGGGGFGLVCAGIQTPVPETNHLCTDRNATFVQDLDHDQLALSDPSSSRHHHHRRRFIYFFYTKYIHNFGF